MSFFVERKSPITYITITDETDRARDLVVVLIRIGLIQSEALCENLRKGSMGRSSGRTYGTMSWFGITGYARTASMQV